MHLLTQVMDPQNCWNNLGSFSVWGDKSRITVLQLNHNGICLELALLLLCWCRRHAVPKIPYCLINYYCNNYIKWKQTSAWEKKAHCFGTGKHTHTYTGDPHPTNFMPDGAMRFIRTASLTIPHLLILAGFPCSHLLSSPKPQADLRRSIPGFGFHSWMEHFGPEPT